MIIPVATMIETGNLIGKSPRGTRKKAADQIGGHHREKLHRYLPPGDFSDQSILWESISLQALARQWPDLTEQNLCQSMGDATIKTVADYHDDMGFEVEIATSDLGLRESFRKNVVG
ncbi:MAG: hypothetical protein HQM06_11025 [Magnetococcales bacterium]|nr:hypothetical protein [Magnetococcales bacterium]